ncbi:MAG: UDP-2,3-diacylglucosamine diphosphatase [Thermodesulfobacteriota bacterium]
MKIVFVADAHLKGLDDPNQASLVKFLDSLAGIDLLVILGDLFDFWGGDNRVVRRYYRPTLDALVRIKERGVKILYLEGNHDFSMGRFFIKTLEADVYGDSVEIEVDGGRRFFLAHGDIITGGVGHAAWRQSLKSGIMRLLMTSAGPWITWKVAMALSKKSRQYSEKKEVEARLREFAARRIASGSDAVVLGHSHVPGVHREKADGRDGTYANPGSWAGAKSYLVYEEGEFRLKQWG